MPGIGAYALAGAVEGAGLGMVEQAKAKRAAAIETLKHERQLDRDTTEMDFRRSENEKDRAANRENRRSILAGTDGVLHSIRGDKAVPITTPDNEPFKGIAGDGKNTPAEVRTAEWLVAKGIAPDVKQAWEIVRSARTNPDATRASIFKSWMSALTKGAFNGVDGEKVQAEARKRTEETMKYLLEPTASEAPAAGRGLPQPKTMSGSGTEDDPFKARKPAHLKWVQKHAPSGTVVEIEIDGKVQKVRKD